MDKDGNYQQESTEDVTRYCTDSLAKFAYSIMWKAVQFAKEHRVPIVLDY